MQTESTADLSAALAKAQAGMQAAKFDKTNPHFKNKYASLAAVIDAIRKPLADNGLSYTQTTHVREGGFVLVTTLRHATGQWIASEYPLPMGAKPQELGSALTYARRYSLSAIACIAADEDDDAEGARTSGQTASTPGSKASPIKPQPVAAPVNPETGELGPHKLKEIEGTQHWAALFIAAINTASDDAEADQWLKDNTDGLGKLKSVSEKAYKYVMAAVDNKRSAFKQEAA